MPERINLGNLTLEKNGRRSYLYHCGYFSVTVKPSGCQGPNTTPWQICFHPEGGPGYIVFIKSLHPNSLRSGLKKSVLRSQESLKRIKDGLDSIYMSGAIGPSPEQGPPAFRKRTTKKSLWSHLEDS